MRILDKELGKVLNADECVGHSVGARLAVAVQCGAHGRGHLGSEGT